jgi:transcriptional regulator with XRE-family HTH domain
MKSTTLKRLKFKQIMEQVKNRTLIPVSTLGSFIKDMRSVLGMSQRQMAKKLDLSAPTLNKIEKNIESSSFKTVNKVLSVIECELMVSVVEKKPISQFIKDRAYFKASDLLSRTYANMAMEKQSPSKKDYEKRLKEFVEELESNPNHSLWED